MDVLAAAFLVPPVLLGGVCSGGWGPPAEKQPPAGTDHPSTDRMPTDNNGYLATIATYSLRYL